MTDLTNTEITNKLKTIQIETVDKLYRELSQQTDIKPFSIKYNDIANYFSSQKCTTLKGQKVSVFSTFTTTRISITQNHMLKKCFNITTKKPLYGRNQDT